ncbi:uncharacterized protein WCC33_007720 [Rhinophrynus dorsalis]
MKGNSERLTLYQEFVLYYETKSHGGDISLCEKLGAKENSHLLSVCSPPAGLGSSCFQVIKESCMGRNEEVKAKLLRNLINGFAILELICVNLFLYPWRKEIRTLKKFTGNFVYFVKPVIPEHTVKQILQRIGYTVVTETEYIVGGLINAEEAKQAAFELFLSRIQCEELIRLIEEDRVNCMQSFFKGHNSEIDRETISEPDVKTAPVPAINPKCNKLDIEDKDLDFKYPENKFAMSPVSKIGHNCVTDNFTDDSSYLYSKQLDSEDFLKKYSDLNLAQKPIFPRHSTRYSSQKTKDNKINQGKQPEFEDDLMTQIRDSSALLTAANHKDTDLSIGQQFVQEAISDVRGKRGDVKTHIHGISKAGNIGRPLGNIMIGEPPAEFSISSKQGHLERSVIKLKIENMADEALGYPIEETLQPNTVMSTSSKEGIICESKKTLVKCKEFDCSTSLAAIDSLFSATNTTCPLSKAVECTSGPDNVSCLREPPSSTYIPPLGAERQCMRITDMTPVENNFQTPSPPADVILIDQTFYKMNIDIRDDFVVITRRENPQS